MRRDPLRDELRVRYRDVEPFIKLAEVAESDRGYWLSGKRIGNTLASLTTTSPRRARSSTSRN